ncbi:tRNA(Ile)-lysidine synthase [Mesomycoplasma dispar]|uniref:tRNA(Ile)-lysidine synthase n=1 Tax=Mesomycoplasma dispar TaxID=86660 RepID=A0AAJ5TC09_9BACT|nr:tRNA lysidine(34) synthetase TilS [Mesomycoplasma dispar]AJR12080.1 tRNA(Ile)-lysidine synthetase [Mesomycoplasma dispar]VEU61447.1 tRNA(Ile)-lysidine synthase [Mesomycoplasma dispar]
MQTKTKPKEKYLIAVSGGSDSMFLLNKYKKKDVIVAHINYNLRPEAIFETILVAKFCQKHNLKLKILSFDSFRISGNLQNELRKARYKFFQHLYEQFNCTKLLVAHHRNDFLETVFLQKNKEKIVSFWGIRKKNYLFNMQILRPLLHSKTKKQILYQCQKKSIPFLDDSSNFTGKYQRNRVRFLLEKRSNFSLFFLFLLYYFINLFKLLMLKYQKKIFQKWEKTGYNIKNFKKIRIKSGVVFLYINQNFEEINLTKGKIKSIIDFICAKSANGIFLLKKNNYIIKKKWKIYAKSSKI